MKGMFDNMVLLGCGICSVPDNHGIVVAKGGSSVRLQTLTAASQSMIHDFQRMASRIRTLVATSPMPKAVEFHATR